jgi:hemolysin activation/secretion protein
MLSLIRAHTFPRRAKGPAYMINNAVEVRWPETKLRLVQTDFRWSVSASAFSVAVFAVSVCPFASAQTRPDAGSILQQQREMIEVPTRPATGIPKAPEPRRAGTIAGSVQVTDFRINGNTLLSDERLLAVVAPFKGRTLADAELRQVLIAIEDVYRNDGYVTAVAYYPEQKVTGGVLEISIVEGRLGRVMLDSSGLKRIKPSVAQGILGTLESGAPIREADLEKRLYLLQDVNGMVTVTSELSPGAAVGEGDLLVKVEDSPARFGASVDVDNGGTNATGTYRFGTNLRFNNALGLGDQVSARLIYQDFDGQTALGRFNYILPAGNWGTKLGFGYSRVGYKIGGDFKALDASGSADTYSLFATHPIIRARNLNLFGQIGYDFKALADKTGNPLTEVKRQIDAGKAGLFGDFRQSNGSISVGSILVTSGKLDIRDTQDPTNANDVGRTNGSFEKLNLDFQTVQFLGGTDSPFSVSATVSAQSARKNLASAERLNLGGANGVRAYPTGQLIADEGVLFQGELRYSPRLDFLPSETLGASTIALFYDAAAANVCRNVDLCNSVGGTTPANNRLQGAGFGVRLNKPGSHLIRVDVAWRTGGDAITTGDRSSNPRVWFQIIKNLI